MGMSDDQIAILGSFAALGFCGILMALSYHFGAAGKQKTGERPAVPQQASTGRQPSSERKAA